MKVYSKTLRSSMGNVNGLYRTDATDDDGICLHCKEWDAQLVGKFCRDRECKHERLVKALTQGHLVQTGRLKEKNANMDIGIAFQASDGTFTWRHN